MSTKVDQTKITDVNGTSLKYDVICNTYADYDIATTDWAAGTTAEGYKCTKSPTTIGSASAGSSGDFKDVSVPIIDIVISDATNAKTLLAEWVKVYKAEIDNTSGDITFYAYSQPSLAMTVRAKA